MATIISTNQNRKPRIDNSEAFFTAYYRAGSGTAVQFSSGQAIAFTGLGNKSKNINTWEQPPNAQDAGMVTDQGQLFAHFIVPSGVYFASIVANNTILTDPIQFNVQENGVTQQGSQGLFLSTNHNSGNSIVIVNGRSEFGGRAVIRISPEELVTMTPNATDPLLLQFSFFKIAEVNRNTIGQ